MAERSSGQSSEPSAWSGVRLDVWLWRARFWKTRSQAAQAVESGAIRLIRPGREPVRVGKPSQSVQPGEQLTFVLQSRAVHLEILAPGVRRGPPDEARQLYRLIGAE